MPVRVGSFIVAIGNYSDPVSWMGYSSLMRERPKVYVAKRTNIGIQLVGCVLIVLQMTQTSDRISSALAYDQISLSYNVMASRTVRLEQQDRIFAKLIELGVDERWLMETNPTPKEARGLLKGILYLKEMYPDIFNAK
jgi:hypothetical protein